MPLGGRGGKWDLIINVLVKANKFLKPLQVMIVGMAAVICSAVGLVGILAKITREQSQAMANLRGVLRSTGGAAGYTFGQMMEMAQAFQTVTTYGDEAIITAQSILLTFKEIGHEVFPAAVQATLDIATVMGTNLKSAALQVGKALQEPGIGLTALRRAGVSFTEHAKEQIKVLTKYNKTLYAQYLILGEIQGQLHKVAQERADTPAGRVTQLKNRFTDLLQKIGFAAWDKFGEWIIDKLEYILGWLDKNAGNILNTIVAAFNVVWNSILVTVAIIKKATMDVIQFIDRVYQWWLTKDENIKKELWKGIVKEYSGNLDKFPIVGPLIQATKALDKFGAENLMQHGAHRGPTAFEAWMGEGYVAITKLEESFDDLIATVNKFTTVSLKQTVKPEWAVWLNNKITELKKNYAEWMADYLIGMEKMKKFNKDFMEWAKGEGFFFAMKPTKWQETASAMVDIYRPILELMGVIKKEGRDTMLEFSDIQMTVLNMLSDVAHHFADTIINVLYGAKIKLKSFLSDISKMILKSGLMMLMNWALFGSVSGVAGFGQGNEGGLFGKVFPFLKPGASSQGGNLGGIVGGTAGAVGGAAGMGVNVNVVGIPSAQIVRRGERTWARDERRWINQLKTRDMGREVYRGE